MRRPAVGVGGWCRGGDDGDEIETGIATAVSEAVELSISIGSMSYNRGSSITLDFDPESRTTVVSKLVGAKAKQSKAGREELEDAAAGESRSISAVQPYSKFSTIVSIS